MPNFKGHILGGLCIYAAAVFLLSLSAVPLSKHIQWFLATMAGSIFPDIDVRSKGQHLFLSILLMLLILCLFLNAYIPILLVLFFSFLPLILPHRGLFHDLGFIVIMAAMVALFLIYLMPQQAGTILSTTVFFLLGTVSHLVLDKGFKKTFHK